MTNFRVGSYTTSVKVIYCIAMCLAVFSYSGIWGINTSSCLSMITTGSVVIDFYVAIYIVIEDTIAIAIAIAIVINIFIVVTIAVVIFIAFDIIVTIAIVVAVGVVDDTGFHM